MRGFLLVFILAVAMNAAAQHNTLTEQEERDGWILLFDGTSVDAWRGYNKKAFPEAGWRIQDGQLIVEYSGSGEDGDGGDIITVERFRDFEFVVDVMLTDSANSGVFYIATEFEGQPIWHNAPEFQLIDDAVYESMLGNDWMDTHRTGDNYDMEAAAENFSRPVGEWNNVRIIKRGNSVEHWLNEHLAVSYEINSIPWINQYKRSKFKDFPMYGRNSTGHIGLQDHGHEVRFRNIKIRRL